MLALPLLALGRAHSRVLTYTALALSLFITGAAPAADIPELVARAKPAVVQIVAYDEVSQTKHLGTGWFMDDGEVVTNFHVIAGASPKSIRARTASGELLKLQTLDYRAFDPDLAAFTVVPADNSDPDDFRPYEVRPSLTLGDSSAAREGERVLVIGNPEGLYGTVSDGIISAFRDKGNIIQITAPISPGSSGSPVLNEKGEVIGIATAVGKEGQNLNFAASSNAIEDLITEQVILPLEYKSDVPAKQVDLRKIESSLDKAYADLVKILAPRQQILLEIGSSSLAGQPAHS